MAKKKTMSRKARRAKQARAARMQKIRYGGLALIVLVAIAGLVLWRNAGQPAADAVAANTAPNLDGTAVAPVRVIEYGDLGCSACRSWHQAGIKEQLKAEYGDQVAFEFRHFAVITANSPDAAEAAQCAAEQDSFWAFHDYIYEELPPYPPLDRASLKTYASTVGLDREAFDACLDSRKYETLVLAQAQQARQAGARGTPTFVVDGQVIPLPSYQNLAQAIETTLGN